MSIYGNEPTTGMQARQGVTFQLNDLTQRLELLNKELDDFEGFVHGYLPQTPPLNPKDMSGEKNIRETKSEEYEVTIHLHSLVDRAIDKVRMLHERLEI